MRVYISMNTLSDMGATCANVVGDLACTVAMKQTVNLKRFAAAFLVMAMKKWVC